MNLPGHSASGCREACAVAGLAVLDGEVLGERREERARAVLKVVLLAGLPPHNSHALRVL
ncbi:hypothetical protein AB0K89_05105 [Streptomyces cinnamoneus]|uniref:hypothetical protein n=1 Tax=Streptomyces cinnamoneus TaxID=53446 RepID=UPI003420D7AD